MEAGSLKAIWYVFCQLVDEIMHGLGILPEEWQWRFCQWAHRYDLEDRK